MRWRWAIRLGVLALLIGYLKFVGLDSKFYYPDRKVHQRPEDLRLVYEDVHFPTTDGLTLHGWFLPAEGTARGTVIQFHGNAANITAHVGLVWWLPAAGYNVLLFDYRGYGESEGRVTRVGTIADGNAAIDYALRRPDVAGKPLYLYGQSLGAAVGIVVAADRPEVAAVVAESPFSGYRRVAARHAQGLVYASWAARALAWLAISDGYDPLDYVGRIAPRPLLVIVAEKDTICFPEQGRELYEAAGAPKDFWSAPGSAHLEICFDHDGELRERILGFLDHPPSP
ncbi:MAG: alpha/beta hydrolase [Phycisphaerae bacterium]|jgi:fermentation-respiration switch protein FrsA (DUF1100 family)